MTEGAMWCPNCGAEYLSHVTTCADCHVPLTDTRPPPKDHQVVTYGFADWTDEQRRLLELLLRGRDVSFTWEHDVDLVVSRGAEDTVDEILEHIESLPGGNDATGPGPAVMPFD